MESKDLCQAQFLNDLFIMLLTFVLVISSCVKELSRPKDSEKELSTSHSWKTGRRRAPAWLHGFHGMAWTATHHGRLRSFRKTRQLGPRDRTAGGTTGGTTGGHGSPRWQSWWVDCQNPECAALRTALCRLRNAVFRGSRTLEVTTLSLKLGLEVGEKLPVEKAHMTFDGKSPAVCCVKAGSWLGLPFS